MRFRLLALGLVAAATAGLSAQSAPGVGYLTPPKVIVDILDAAPLPSVAVSPARDVIAVLPRRSMPSIAELSQPMLRLAGIRINPANNGPHRAAAGTGITLRTIATGAERPVTVPPGARVGNVTFDGPGANEDFGLETCVARSVRCSRCWIGSTPPYAVRWC